MQRNKEQNTERGFSCRGIYSACTENNLHLNRPSLLWGRETSLMLLYLDVVKCDGYFHAFLCFYISYICNYYENLKETNPKWKFQYIKWGNWVSIRDYWSLSHKKKQSRRERARSKHFSDRNQTGTFFNKTSELNNSGSFLAYWYTYFITRAWSRIH